MGLSVESRIAFTAMIPFRYPIVPMFVLPSVKRCTVKGTSLVQTVHPASEWLSAMFGKNLSVKSLLTGGRR